MYSTPISGDKLSHTEGLFPDARRTAEVCADPQEGRGQVGVRVHGQEGPEAEGQVWGMMKRVQRCIAFRK